MQQKLFRSKTTCDEIFSSILPKIHKGFFTINKVDDATEHINLIGQLADYFKSEDVKWVEMKISFDPIIPMNTMYYNGKVNECIICHIEDFEKFYFSNVFNFINENNVHVSSKKEEDGWTTVSYGKSKKVSPINKQHKLKSIKEELQQLVGDWKNI